MSIYEINGKTIDLSPLKQSEINDLLSPYHKCKDVRIFCLCTTSKQHTVHVSQRYGNYFLIKHAQTGSQHEKLCHHYSLTAREAACMGYSSDVIIGDESGKNITISLDSPLRLGATEENGGEKVQSYEFRPGLRREVLNRMTLLGLLHLIWEKAGLHKINSYETKESVWLSLRRASSVIRPRGHKNLQLGLADMLLLPIHAETINQSKRNWAKLDDAYKRKKHVLFIAKLSSSEVDGLNFNQENKEGFSLEGIFGISLGLHPDRANDLLAKFNKSFGDELAYSKKGADIILFGIARVYKIEKKYSARIERITAMPVACEHIPFDSSYEWSFIEELVKQKRHFEKPLKYDSAFPVFPDFVLRDCNPAIVVEVYGRTDDDYLERKKEKKTIYGSGGYPHECWEWEAADHKDLVQWLVNNPLPSPNGGRETLPQLEEAISTRHRLVSMF